MKNFLPKLSYVYLLTVPAAATAMAFIVGHVSYMVYIPGWILNSLIMIMAAKTLSGQRQIQHATWPFIFCWMLIAIFGGMGPPPSTAAEWALLADEQRLRYTILIISSLLACTGFLRLNKLLRSTPGASYAGTGKTILLIATPFFIANMAYWGYFLTTVFVDYPEGGARPTWVKSVGGIFTAIRMFEVSLIYLSTAAFVKALQRAGWLSSAGALVYLIFCFAGAVLNVLPEDLPDPLATANYVSYIPAFTLLMPYLIGVNLLRKKEINLKIAGPSRSNGQAGPQYDNGEP